jgi:hypothetical protein
MWMARWTPARIMGAFAMLGVLGVLTSGIARAGQAAASGKLDVVVNYTGQGAVDQDHRVWIWLFDTPNITVDAEPIATGVVSSNGAGYKFVGLPKQVYVAAAYDAKGGYDGTSGAPPSGTPYTIYGGGSGAATPVPTGGDDASVNVSFDDSLRIP